MPIYSKPRAWERALVLAWEGEVAPEGMDRAARRLAGTRKLGLTAPSWRGYDPYYDPDLDPWKPAGWALGGFERDSVTWWIDADSGAPPDRVIPALSAVDPISSLADAHALAIVCAHVLGGRAEVLLTRTNQDEDDLKE
jgi:hypothetical protein